ncbi:MAG: thioredoxin domain-containing protein [Candidatus Magasanikbacteria bacterium]|nr:thioredoxin domain-containing protein [Candidatus Magasanikbacteria bacterium]
MLNTKKILLVFIPAILLVSATLFIRIVQYEPLFPDIAEKPEKKTGEFVIPIFPLDPIIGNKKAPTTIVAFEDFACPACVEQSAMLDVLLQKYPDSIKIIWKGLPVSEFPYSSLKAHTYGFCAHAQDKFEPFRKLALANSDNLSDSILGSIAESIELKIDKLSECLESRETLAYIDTVEQIALILNIQAVPTFFMDNKQIVTPKTEFEWETILKL